MLPPMAWTQTCLFVGGPHDGRRLEIARSLDVVVFEAVGSAVYYRDRVRTTTAELELWRHESLTRDQLLAELVAGYRAPKEGP